MKWLTNTIALKPRKRGFHLITREIEKEVEDLQLIKTGIAHVFIRHTSASLTINENADPTVRRDFEAFANHLVSEKTPYFIHTYEGPDDMPAHLKSSIFGSSITIPVLNGRFNLGTWQGIYLGEHRNHASSRQVTITVWGEEV